MADNAIKKAHKLKDRARRTAIRLASRFVSNQGAHDRADTCYCNLCYAYPKLKSQHENDVSWYCITTWSYGITDLARILIDAWCVEHGGRLVKREPEPDEEQDEWL
jgi:hypothetical protein